MLLSERNAAGQLIEQQDEAGTVRRAFDAEGRVVSVKEDGKDTKRRSYDLLGRIVSSTDQYGNTLQYTYDAGGRLATLVYPDGKTVRYTYDLAGQLTMVTDWAGRITRYTYDENYRLIRTERPNGTVEQRHYDAAGQLLRLWDQNAQGVMLQQYRFVYNELGQIIQEEEKQYTYDALRRLTSGAMAGRKILYTYDQGGNITAIGDSASSLATAMTYAKDNRLDTVDGQPVQYDEDGNLLLLPGKQQPETYAYDVRNRLVRAGQARYTYDAEYVRTPMTWNGKTTRYVVDQNADLTQVLMELEESGTARAYYVYGLGLIGREDAQGDYLSYHADTRGSTTLLTDEHGRVTDRYTYGLYGELEVHEGRTKQPFCYNGRDGVMTDPNGLYYMRARYYHPGLKRFLNRDVLQGDMTDGQTFNRFAYVNGDPIGFIDPLGLMKCKEGTGKSSKSKFEFDYDTERELGIKRITDEFGGMIESVGNRSKTLNPKEIRFMQSSISNKTGQYTVLDNAKAFSENPSKIFELNPIRVWQDGKGNIWTLDHRRLGAARLADLDKIPVQWASKAEVYQDAWKFSTRVDGKSIALKIGKGLKEVIE